MSYAPDPNAAIGKIFQCINDEYISFADLRDRITNQFPEIPKNAFHTHINFLIEKKVVHAVMKDGVRYFIKANASKPLVVNKESDISKPYLILGFCKQRIGQHINSSQLKEEFNWHEKDTTAATILTKLKNLNVLQLIPSTKPYEYLVLPTISQLDKVGWAKKAKQELIPKSAITEKDISQMNIGEIIADYASVKAENQRLKSSLQRIAVELMDIIEIEK